MAISEALCVFWGGGGGGLFFPVAMAKPPIHVCSDISGFSEKVSEVIVRNSLTTNTR